MLHIRESIMLAASFNTLGGLFSGTGAFFGFNDLLLVNQSF